MHSRFWRSGAWKIRRRAGSRRIACTIIVRDERPDPHSPLVNLFWSHMGWLFLQNTDLGRQVAYDRYARDILRDRFYRFIERYVVWVTLSQSVLYFAAGFLIALVLGDAPMAALQFAASIWLWGVVVRTVIVWHITWSVNSLAHRVRLSELRHRGPQPQQCAGGDPGERRGVAQQSPLRAELRQQSKALVGDRPDISPAAPLRCSRIRLGRPDADAPPKLDGFTIVPAEPFVGDSTLRD